MSAAPEIPLRNRGGTEGAGSVRATAVGSRRGRPSRAQERAITQKIVETALMKRIGEEAGVAPNTLYLRFADKAALFRALIEWKVAFWKVTNPPRRSRAKAGLVEILELAALGMLEAIARDDVAAIGRLLAMEGERFPELARIYRESAMQVGRNELLDRIVNAPDADLADEDAADLVTTLTEVIVGHTGSRMFYDPAGTGTLRQVARRIARVIGAGHTRRP